MERRGDGQASQKEQIKVVLDGIRHTDKALAEMMIAIPAVCVLITRQPSWLPSADKLSLLAFLAPFHQVFLAGKDLIKTKATERFPRR